MFNSVNGNVQNGVIVQNNKMQKNNIAYRGKATNALEATPTRDEFQKKGLGKGAKFALGTLGLAGIAVVVDRLFLKGKYTDDILKWLKNNGDDVTKGANEGTDDFGRIVDDEIDLTGISAEDLKSLDDIDFEKLVDDVDLEKFADEAERVLGDPSAIKKADIIFDGVSKPIEKTVKETAEEVQVITPNKNEIVENIEDEVARTKKLIEDAGYQVAEVKPIDDTEGVIKKTIKELDDEAEKVAKKQQEEARRIEQDNLNIAAAAIFADDALRQTKNSTDDIAKEIEKRADDILNDIEEKVVDNFTSNVNRGSDNLVDDVVDDAADNLFPPRNNYGDDYSLVGNMYDDINNPSSNYIDPLHSSSFGMDDISDPALNPIGGLDEFNSPSLGFDDIDSGFGIGDGFSDLF